VIILDTLLIGGIKFVFRKLAEAVDAQLNDDSVLREQAGRHGWAAVVELLDGGGQRVGSVWREPDGSLVLPFDPNEAIQNLTMERYRDLGRSGRRSSGLGVRAYYLLRPVLPRRVQLAMRRAFSRIQARATFPRKSRNSALPCRS